MMMEFAVFPLNDHSLQYAYFLLFFGDYGVQVIAFSLFLSAFEDEFFGLLWEGDQDLAQWSIVVVYGQLLYFLLAVDYVLEFVF